MRRRAVTLAAVLLSLLARDAAAVCVEGFPPCGLFWTADAVFIGTVSGFTCRVTEPEIDGPPSDEVHFKVVEAFRGVTGPSVTLRDWVCGDVQWSESVGFVEGETYFVYAHRGEDSHHLTTSKCSTRTLAESQDAVTYTRTLQQRSQGGRVYGTVIHPEDDWQNGGIVGRELPKGVTDRESAQIIRMTPGADIDLGDLLVPPPLTEVTLTGRVLLADGSPVHRAWVNLIDPAFPSSFVNETVWTDEQGRFTIPAFGGRRYVLQARVERPGAWLEGRSDTIVAGHGGTVVIRTTQENED